MAYPWSEKQMHVLSSLMWINDDDGMQQGGVVCFLHRMREATAIPPGSSIRLVPAIDPGRVDFPPYLVWRAPISHASRFAPSLFGKGLRAVV